MEKRLGVNTPYGYVNVKLNDEGITIDVLDKMGEVIATRWEFWSELDIEVKAS